MSNRRPNAIKARAIQLRAGGLSAREVELALKGEGLRASKSSVAAWCAGPASEGEKASPRPAAGTSPASKFAPGRPGSPPAGDLDGEEGWELPGVDLVHLPAELLERLGRRLARRIADELDGEIDPPVLGALVRDHERVCKALIQARPPMAQDPEQDPGNLEMAAIAVAHIKRMVADIRKRPAAAHAVEVSA